jgi:hypothetical protein
MQAISAEDIIKTIVTGFLYLFEAFGYVLYGIYLIVYYFLRGFRYLFIAASGTGYDLAKSYCTGTNDYLQSSYVKEKVSSISYYDYCIESKTITLNVVVMAIIMIFIAFILGIILMETINRTIGLIIGMDIETKYYNIITERNNRYMIEYHNLGTIKQYMRLSKQSQINIMSCVIVILHIVMSCTGYIVRYYYIMNDFWDPILLSSYFGIMLLTNMCSVFILIIMTPIVERVQSVEISSIDVV